MESKFFVYHDKQGNITSITNEKKSSGDFILAAESEISDFLNGSKDFTKFKIQSLASGPKSIKLSDESSVLIYKDFYILGESKGNEQVILNHNAQKQQWNVLINESNNFMDFSFYICKKDNLNFLLREIKVPAKKTFSVEFILDCERNIEDIVVLAKNVYKSYGINYDQS